ncbi:unnamed protein product [Symbiodinium natans]|uniref:Uncharacterized protein n=1 Tax=Symbiodinium natans TaxID=878477 RepID=A0A812TIX5_9DINO|nr:unnamed protein product [Symbiodinium natans]
MPALLQPHAEPRDVSCVERRSSLSQADLPQLELCQAAAGSDCCGGQFDRRAPSCSDPHAVTLVRMSRWGSFQLDSFSFVVATAQFTRSFSNSSNSAGPSAAERAKKAQELWSTFVPEQHWDFRSPMIPTLILAIVFLQFLISQKQSDVAEKEREEVRLLQDERRARRAATEKALAE